MLTYNQKETADRIRQLRRKQGWSQEQAAHRLGLTAGSLRLLGGAFDVHWGAL